MKNIKNLCTIMVPEPHQQEIALEHAARVNPQNKPLKPTDCDASTFLPQQTRAAMEYRRRWPNGKRLRVHFINGKKEVCRRVADTALEWCKYANITFEFGAGEDAEIRVAFTPGMGSWSYIGTDCSLPILAGRPTMNLGWLTPDTPEIEYKRVVLHEFGHALGLLHEHVSPSAQIPWDEQKVIEYYRVTNGWTEKQTRNNVLLRAQADVYTRFDPESIMLYPVPKELTLNGFEIPWVNSELSFLDKEFISSIYPLGRKQTSSYHATQTHYV